MTKPKLLALPSFQSQIAPKRNVSQTLSVFFWLEASPVARHYWDVTAMRVHLQQAASRKYTIVTIWELFKHLGVTILFVVADFYCTSTSSLEKGYWGNLNTFATFIYFVCTKVDFRSEQSQRLVCSYLCSLVGSLTYQKRIVHNKVLFITK